MKKRLTAVFLCLSLILTLLPATAFAADTTDTGTSSPTITVGDAELTGSAGNPAYAITTSKGVVTTEGATAANYNVKWDGETLILRNAVIIAANNQDVSIICETPFTLLLEGKNTIDNDNTAPGIVVFSDGTINTPAALTISGEGSLTITSSYIGIYVAGNILIQSGTVTATATSNEDKISAGIVTVAGNILIEGGTVTARGGNTQNISSGIISVSGLTDTGTQIYGGTVQISGGQVTASSGDAEQVSAGILTDYSTDTTDNSSPNSIRISGGEVTATAGKGGIISSGLCNVVEYYPSSTDLDYYTDGTTSVSPAAGERIEAQAGDSSNTAAAVPGSPFESGSHDITDAVTGKAYFHSKAFTPVKEEPQVPAEKPSPEVPSTPQPAALTTGATYTAGGNTYRAASANTVVVKTVANKKTVKIPSTVTVNGVKAKVTAIDKNAFKKAKKKLTKVVIGANVTTIGKKAFAGCKKLRKITIKTKKLKSVGKKAFKGINKNAIIKVPKAKKKAYNKLLRNKGQAKTVKIR